MIKLLAQERGFSHFPAVREDIAVGMSAGAFLSGKLPVIYMQNSGLGYSLEAFASIHMIYHILVLVSFRGPQDQGMEEHQVMGKHTIRPPFYSLQGRRPGQQRMPPPSFYGRSDQRAVSGFFF